jgi:hypothetical protein
MATLTAFSVLAFRGFRVFRDQNPFSKNARLMAALLYGFRFVLVFDLDFLKQWNLQRISR